LLDVDRNVRAGRAVTHVAFLLIASAPQPSPSYRCSLDAPSLRLLRGGVKGGEAMAHIPEDRQFSFERLEVWQLAMEVVVEVDAIVRALPRAYAELADQLRRASLSIVTNFAEGVGKEGRDQQRYFRTSRGSAYESAAATEAAWQLQLISSESRGRVRQRLLSVAALLTSYLRAGC